VHLQDRARFFTTSVSPKKAQFRHISDKHLHQRLPILSAGGKGNA
jgi:hypothetical protein